MTTRFNARPNKNFGLSSLPTGYDEKGADIDLFIPPCGIEDVDKAFFDLFEKEIQIQIIGSDSLPAKVPVIFAAGEKWSLLKKGRPLRDRNNTLILPLITIMRTDVVQSNEDVTGRGINQQSGEIIVRRKLDKSDRNYQALINKMLLTNQPNVSSTAQVGQVSTLRKTGQSVNDAQIKQQALLYPNVNNNIIETIVVPSPQFYTVKYQVSVWTQYMQHTNQIIEKIVSSYLPQAQSWKITSAKGYWFVAKVQDGGFATETSFEDLAQTERFIKSNFEVAVPAYFFASRAPGSPIPLKKYVSSPIISFEADTTDYLDVVTNNPVNNFEINDIDPITGKKLLTRNTTENVNGYVNGSDDPTIPTQESTLIAPTQPLVSNNINRVLADESRNNSPTVKVITKNSKGETVFTGADLGKLQIILSNN